MGSTITTLLCLSIGLVSYLCFQNRDLFNKLEFNAHSVVHKKEYYRLFTHGWVHGDWNHLLINLFVLYAFGTNTEAFFTYNFPQWGRIYYLILILLALPISSTYDLIKYKDQPYYNAVGASGAVSAIVFCSIFLDPWGKIYLFMILPIPGLLFGAGYLYYSYYMAKQNRDNIGHYAHFFGAVFGFFYPLLINYKVFFQYFIDKL
ncbi:MAG: rhomboid family intramembrane serine protease [Prolixibacteraceae bacterium]